MQEVRFLKNIKISLLKIFKYNRPSVIYLYINGLINHREIFRGVIMWQIH